MLSGIRCTTANSNTHAEQRKATLRRVDRELDEADEMVGFIVGLSTLM